VLRVTGCALCYGVVMSLYKKIQSEGRVMRSLQWVPQPHVNNKLVHITNLNKYSYNGKSEIKLSFVFFWVIPLCLNFVCQCFGTLCLFHLHTYPPVKMEQTECSEMSAYKIQTPGNYPEENIQNTEHGESLKSRSKI